MRAVMVGRQLQALTGLYRALEKNRVPGASFNRSETDPAVYTQDTCTRVREGMFFIKRVSPYGAVLETASISVDRVTMAAAMVHAMTTRPDFK